MGPDFNQILCCFLLILGPPFGLKNLLEGAQEAKEGSQEAKKKGGPRDPGPDGGPRGVGSSPG